MERTASYLLIAVLSILLLAGCGQYGEPIYPEGIYADNLDESERP